MVYDSARGRVVLFGGHDGVRSLGDTWEWDGTAWTRKTPATSPSVGYGHAMAYDSARGRVVLFGGSVGSGSDTWEWDGTVWTQKTPATSPSARHAHAMAYDSARGRVVLFGGEYSSGSLGDTWEWDGTVWTQKTPATSPAVRYAHAMAYDSARGRVVLFGGLSNNTHLGDTWEWDGAAWTQKTPATSPSSRRDHAMAYDSARGRVVLSGGYRSGLPHSLGDTWEWDGTAWTQRTPATSPSARYAHEIAYDSTRGRVVLFGGYGSDYLGDTWEWDGTAWIENTPVTTPSVRYAHAMAYDSRRERLVLFGGLSNDTYLVDTWEWDGAAWNRKTPATSPAARDFHAMAYDSARGRVVLFGGYGGFGSVLGDTWEWDGAAWTQKTPVTSPPPGGEHAMAYDSARGRVVLFGESSSGSPMTWEWDGTVWTQKSPATSPPNRRDHAMAYDSARGRVVLFGGGGCPPSGLCGDTWEWDGTVWDQKSASTSPAARAYYAMAYDSARGRVVLFGGLGSGFHSLADTWEWDGTAWTQVTPATSPSVRYGHAMAYDSARGRVALFGGLGSGFLGDTWEYGECGEEFIEDLAYGSLLFRPLCTLDSDSHPGGPGTPYVYDSKSLGVFKGMNDRFFLSSQGKQFLPLVADDTVHINGLDAGLGPYSDRPGVPPYLYSVPIERNVVPLPAHDVTGAVGSSLDLFELLDTQQAIYGNTAVYLVRDCGIWLDKQTDQTRLNWVSQQVLVGGSQSDLNVVSGRSSQLQADHNFSRACFLGLYSNTTQVVDIRPSPPLGDGYYYLVSGTCASPIGYGNSLRGMPPKSAPRVGVPGPETPCP